MYTIRGLNLVPLIFFCRIRTFKKLICSHAMQRKKNIILFLTVGSLLLCLKLTRDFATRPRTQKELPTIKQLYTTELTFRRGNPESRRGERSGGQAGSHGMNDESEPGTYLKDTVVRKDEPKVPQTSSERETASPKTALYAHGTLPLTHILRNPLERSQPASSSGSEGSENGRSWNDVIKSDEYDEGSSETESDNEPENVQKKYDSTEGNTKINFRNISENLYNLAPNVFDGVPEKFLPEFRNPCWWSQLSGEGNTSPSLKCLPYFFLAGMPKSGTTDVNDKLHMHPQVFRARVKEPHWWTRRRLAGINLSQYINYQSVNIVPQLVNGSDPSIIMELFMLITNGRGDYVFSLCGTPASLPLCRVTTLQLTIATLKHGKTSATISFSTLWDAEYNQINKGDSSASTFWDNEKWRQFFPHENVGPPHLIAEIIHTVLPKSKIIVTFRDPVARLFSDFNFFVPHDYDLGPSIFHRKVVDYLVSFKLCLVKERDNRTCAYDLQNATQARASIGLYSIYLRDWLKVFPRDQIKVIRLEDWRTNCTEMLPQLFEFLQLRKLDNAAIEKKCRKHPSNVNKRPSKPMLPETKQLLREFYQPFNEELALMLTDDKYLWKDSTL